MKARKITAVMLAAAMCFSAAGASVYADDPAIEAIEDDFYEAAPVEESAYEEDLEGEGIIDTEYNCDTFTDGAVGMGDDEEDAIDASADADFDIVRELSDAVECGIEEGIEESEAYDAAIEAGAEEAAYEEDAFEEEASEEEAFEDGLPGDEDEPLWLMLCTETGGSCSHIMIFEKADGTWADEQGLIYTENVDGTWTDANGTVYHEDFGEGTDEYTGIDFDPVEMNLSDRVFLAGTESGIKDTAVKETKKITQAAISGVLDLIAKNNPELIPLIAPLKVVIGELFGLNSSPDPNKVMLEKLDEIDAHLTSMENYLKEHCENVVAFDSIGGEFQAITRAIEPLELKIGDIMYQFDKGDIDKEACDRELAALYKSWEYNSLMQGLSGATSAYGGFTSYTLEPTSVFMAAYNLQCNSVMFSGEAVDCVTPYLLRQLCIYLKGYGLINTVLDACEAINGPGKTHETRNAMFRNTGGIVNGTFDEKHPGVFALYEAFFDTYRYTFVNKSSNEANHVKLDRNIIAAIYGSKSYLGANGTAADDKCKAYTPEIMSNCALSAEQMKNLAAYAKEKNTSVYDLLIDRVGFRLEVAPFLDLYSLIGIQYLGQKVTGDTIIPALGNTTLTEYLRNSGTYMPTGSQYFTSRIQSTFGRGCKAFVWNYMQAIKVSQKGALDEKVCVASNSGGAVDAHLLFFMRA